MHIEVYTKEAKNIRSTPAFAPWIAQWSNISAAKGNMMFAMQGGLEVCSPVLLVYVDFHAKAAENM